MRSLGVMTAKDSDTYHRGNEVVIRSNRGIETGLVLCQANEDALTHLDQPPVGHILRTFGDDDAKELLHLEDSREVKLETCQQKIDELKLEMQLVEIEQLLGGERIVIYYLAEDRVDFRDLVKVLASEFQTRIEMKQIGVRDEAKILADYGDCGRPVCCNNHLSQMPPVSMRMAKIQKATLDPTKISGRCGRLKCCLRYEYDTYEEIQKQLPRVGTHIVTRDGRAKVIGQQILAEQLLIETEDHRRMVIDASEVLSVIKKEHKHESVGAAVSPAADDSRSDKYQSKDNDNDDNSSESVTQSNDQKGSRRQTQPPNRTASSQQKSDEGIDEPLGDSKESPKKNAGKQGKRRNQNRSRRKRASDDKPDSGGENGGIKN